MVIKRNRISLTMFFLTLAILTNIACADESHKKQDEEKLQKESQKVANSLVIAKPKNIEKSYLTVMNRKLRPIEIKYLKRVLNEKQDRLKLVFERVVMKRLKKENNELYLKLVQLKKTDKKEFHLQLIKQCLVQYNIDLRNAGALRRVIYKYKSLKQNSEEKKALLKKIKSTVVQAFQKKLAIEKESLDIIYKGYRKAIALTVNREYFLNRLVNERFDNIMKGKASKGGGRASYYNNSNSKTGAVRGLKIAKKNREKFITSFDQNISSTGIDQTLVNLDSNQLLRMSYLKVSDPKYYDEMLELKKRNYKQFAKKIESPRCDIMKVIHARDKRIYDLYLKYKNGKEDGCVTEIKAILKEQLLERLALEKEVLKVLKKGYEINKYRYEKRVKNRKKIIDERVKFLLRDKDLDWFPKI